MKTKTVRGIPFADATAEEVLSYLLEASAAGQQLAVFTPNAEILQHAAEDEAFRRVLLSGDVIVADGVGVLRAAEILGKPLPEKIAGVELGERLAGNTDFPVYFLGGKAGVAEEAAARLSEKYPRLRVAGCHDGYFTKIGAENDLVLEAIRASGAGVVFVSFGSPAQEEWIADNREKLPDVRLLLGLGGSLDVYAGREKRAPAFLIRCRPEWLWRIVRHPSKIGRLFSALRLLRDARREAKQNK